MYCPGILLSGFALLGFVCLMLPEEGTLRDVLIRIRSILMFLFNFTAFLTICGHAEDSKPFVTFIVSQVLMLGILVIGRILYPDSDMLLLGNMCMLLSIGFVVLTRLNINKSLKQLLIVTMSFILSMGVPYLIRRFKHLHTMKWIYASVGIGALGLVLLAGQLTYGANISYTIGGITFQPSEIIKIAFVFFVAAAFCRARSIAEVLTAAAIGLVHILILVLSRDLGSALIYASVLMIMIFVATGNFLYVAAGLAGGAMAAYVAYMKFAHVRERVSAWKDPWSTIDNTGYQITQSLFALSTGSAWGQGLTKGNPTSIPFVEDDFIFSAIVEEMGFVCGIALIAVCISGFLWALKLGFKLHSMFYRLLAIGLGSAYIVQIFVTIAGGVKFIPLTGVTLPFVSYGGSSVLTSILLFEVLIGVGMVQIDEEEFYNNSIREKIDALGIDRELVNGTADKTTD